MQIYLNQTISFASVNKKLVTTNKKSLMLKLEKYDYADATVCIMNILDYCDVL
jgi:hypothetical protein